jgi:ATP-dependent RNA helicase DeaD
MANGFNRFNLHPALVQAVSDLGFSEPTPIQSAVMPALLAGQDVIGQAQTGTGKTAAYGLPILNNLVVGLGKVQSLVLVPTRELALQVATALESYSTRQELSVLAVYGGQPYSRQIGRLRRGVEIVVGTPGRLLDLIQQHALDLSAVQTVILDEADEMLSMGFIEDIETILAETPSTRQTALFSATLPQPIRRLAERYMHEPYSVTIQREQLTVEALEQRYYLVNPAEKVAALTRLFEVEDISSALIFVRTRLGSAELAGNLAAYGYPVEVLNGDLTQESRERVMSSFRQRHISVLVATDVAARGLDIDDISHVFNFDLPDDDEVYIHRVGRTGRAGKTGIAISLVTPQEQWRLRKIETLTRKKVTRCQLPSEQDIQEHRDEQLLHSMRIWLQRARYNKERELAGKLVEEGYDAQEIAAAALRLARAGERRRPIAPVSEVQEKRPPRTERSSPPRLDRRDAQRDRSSHEAGMVRLALSKGRLHGVRPTDVVSTIAFHADIPGSVIGKIHILDQQTLVDVPDQYLAQVLSRSGKYRIHKQPVAVEVASTEKQLR